MHRYVLSALIVLFAALLPSGEARAQTLNQAGLSRFNADIQSLWAQDGIPLALQLGRAELQKLVGTEHSVPSGKAKVLAVNFLHVTAPVAPGVTRMDGSRLEARLPLSGTMRIAAEIRVRVDGKIAWIPFSDTFNVGVELNNVSAAMAADFDSSDPTVPRVTKVYPPQATFTLKVTSTNDLLKHTGWLTTSIVNPVAKVAILVGARYIAQKLNMSNVGTPKIMGGTSALAPVAPADLEGMAIKLERELVAYKMPYGGACEGKFNKDFWGTWEESLNDPGFHPGALDHARIGAAGDQALMTGYYLGAMAFRYATTRSPEALAHAKQALAAYHTLLNMRTGPGDLNRSIIPYTQGFHLDVNQKDYVGTYQGKQYVMSGYVSRDAYTGTLFGLSLAHDLIDDPPTKALAGARLQEAFDYLIRNNWTHRQPDGRMDEHWQGCMEQQYAWVVAAHRTNPTKYAAILEQYKGYSDILWTGIWMSCLDQYYQYFKFALCTASLHTALRCETDPVRFQRTYQGLAIIMRFIRHHQNAQFNSIYMAANPSLVAAYGEENRNLLTRWLRQKRRYVDHDLRSDATIEKETYTLPIDPNQFFPSAGYTQAVIIAKVPIAVEKRISTSMRWDRSPYSLHEDYLWGPEAWHEGEGIDYMLPYWMARYHGACRPPRVILNANPVAVEMSPSLSPMRSR